MSSVPGFKALLEGGISWLTVWVDEALTAWGVSAVLPLVIDGIFNGVGGVLSFVAHHWLPCFFFLSLLEDKRLHGPRGFCDGQTLRKIGLSGRSIADADWLWLYCARCHGRPNPLPSEAGP